MRVCRNSPMALTLPRCPPAQLWGGHSLTRDGVVQDEAQKSTNKHACGQEHLDDLIQLENPWNATKVTVRRDQGPPCFTPGVVTSDSPDGRDSTHLSAASRGSCSPSWGWRAHSRWRSQTRRGSWTNSCPHTVGERTPEVIRALDTFTHVHVRTAGFEG